MSRNLSVCDWKSCLLTVSFFLLALISFSSFVFFAAAIAEVLFSDLLLWLSAILINWCANKRYSS